MYARRSSGLTDGDLHDARVYMMTLNDGIKCLEEIAQREAAK